MLLLHLHAHVLIRREPADVSEYLRTVSAATWRTDLADSTRTPSGPLCRGTLLVERVIVAGRTLPTESVVTDLRPGGGFAYAHRAGPVPISGEVRVAAYDDGTRVDHRVELSLPGGWAFLAPILRLSRPRVMASSLDELRFRLEAAVLPHRSVATVG